MPNLSITGKTRVYGIVAHPIDHVRAPSVLNPAYEKYGIDAVMVPFHVHPDALAAAVAGMKAMRNLGGLCVTVPPKIEPAALCDAPGPSGRRFGARTAVRFDETPDAGHDGPRRRAGDTYGRSNN